MNKKLNTKYVFALMMIANSLLSFNMKENVTNNDLIEVRAYDPSGIWDYTVPTDEGDLIGEMTITKEENEWQIKIESDVYGTLELVDVTFEETKDKEIFMGGNVEIEGDVIDFEFEFDGDTLEGIIGTPDGDLDISAERQKKK